MKRFTWGLLLIICFFIGASVTEADSNQLIIINKQTNQLAFFENGQLVRTFKVATGKYDRQTPVGTFPIVNKIKNRPYYTDNIPGGDPRNPLGDRWLGLSARGTYGTTYAIHGNNNPASIGTYASKGCVRMYDDEVRWLFDRVNLYTNVIITNSSSSFEAIAASNGYSAYSKLEAVKVSHSSPQPEDTAITVTATTSFNLPTSFRFEVFDGEKWSTVQDFSQSNKLVWTPKTAGTYNIRVRVRSNHSDKPFDDEKVIPYTVIKPAKLHSVSAEKESPQPVQTSITFKTKTNNPNDNLVKFLIQTGDKWETIQDYSEATELSWKSTKPSTYNIKIQTKHKLSSNEFDDELVMNYVIFQPASIASITTDKEEPQPIYTAITINTTTNDDSSNLFKFTVYDGERWITLQDFSITKTAVWKPNKSGIYTIKVQAKHPLSKEDTDSEKELTFIVFKPATIQNIMTNGSSLLPMKNKVEITALAQNQEDLEYRFLIFKGTHLIESNSYSKLNNVTWNPTEPGSYKIKVQIKHRLSSNQFDDAHEIPYIVFRSIPLDAVLPSSVRIKKTGTIMIKKRL